MTLFKPSTHCDLAPALPALPGSYSSVKSGTSRITRVSTDPVTPTAFGNSNHQWSNSLSTDLPDTLNETLIWSTTEPCTGIVCACLPTLRPVIRVILGGSQRLKSTGSKVGSTSRSLLRNLRQKLQSTNSEVCEKGPTANGQHAVTRLSDWSIIFKGSSSSELRSVEHDVYPISRNMV
jgi:hypothetical protein